MAKILFVLTGAGYRTLADGTIQATGCWAEEFAAPYGELTTGRSGRAGSVALEEVM